MKQCLEIVNPIQLEYMTALTLKMQELVVKVLRCVDLPFGSCLFGCDQLQFVRMEISDL